MQKIKLNKKILIVAIILLFAMIFSVFAINNAIKTNKAATNTNISPYKYRMVVAYFAYWKTGDSYFADINGVRTNIGKVPYQYFEPSYKFPVATISGNYQIAGIMNYKDYDGSWDELNYIGGLSQDEINDHYMNTAFIENTPAVIGAQNTEVTLISSFKPLNPKGVGLAPDPYKRYAIKDGSVYYSYIAIVIKYVDSDYVKDPPKWWEEHGGNPDNPDPNTGDVMVYVEHKDKETGKSLTNLQKVNTSMGNNLILSCMDLDGYKCVSSTIKGLAEKNYSQNNIDVKVGLFDYTTPEDGYLYVTFWYEEYKEPEKPKCDPQFDAEADDARITMKRRDFEKATSIYFSNIRIAIDDYKGGYKQVSGIQWDKIDGSHKFQNFDLYLKFPGSTAYDFTRHDIYSNSVYQSLNVPKIKFTPTNTEKTEYLVNVEVTLGVMCECGGFTAEKTSFNLYIDIVENQPPDAYYKYATKKTLPSGTESREYGKAYIGKNVVIYNYATDPNGLTDIDYVRFVFKNKNNSEQVKSVQLKMMPWGAYELDEADSFVNTSIVFNGAKENGSLNIQFTTEEEWEVSLYVQDAEGLNDTYTEIIKPEILNLKPTAVIKDTINYRYPSIIQEFSGKQNRVIKLDSKSSYVASWLQDYRDITIDHSKDMWQIEPLEGQKINSVKFERDINKIITGDILNARYEPLDIKIMFKEPGRYSIRLQVTDTEGNISNWSEQIITINEDLPPTVNANINNKFYRSSNSIANLYLTNINTSSSDMDNTFITFVGYKYDSNNDGSFNDELLNEIQYNDQSITLQTSKLGKYQFIVRAKEAFGQETMSKYIEEKDYKTTILTLVTEVDNIAPDITSFKIMTVE